MFTPTHLDQLAIDIRKRVGRMPRQSADGRVFDWVDQVSIELTTQMLATLFDFPLEERRKLTHWSDIATSTGAGDPDCDARTQRQAELLKCANISHGCGTSGWTSRRSGDLLSMMAHSEATRDMDPMNFLGNLDPLDRRRQRHHPQHAVGRRYFMP